MCWVDRAQQFPTEMLGPDFSSWASTEREAGLRAFTVDRGDKCLGFGEATSSSLSLCQERANLFLYLPSEVHFPWGTGARVCKCLRDTVTLDPNASLESGLGMPSGYQ